MVTAANGKPRVVDVIESKEIAADRWIPTACNMCYNHCSIQVRRLDGVAVKIEGLPGAQPNYGKTCAKGNAAFMNVYNPGRVLHPLVRTNPEKGIGVDPGWKAVSWEEALELATQRLRTAREKDPRGVMLASFDSVVRELRSAFAAAFGTPNNEFGSASFFCGQGQHPISYMLTGSNDMVPDLGHSDLVLMFGTSYGFVSQHNAMGITQEMADARMRGMKLVVIDPVCSYAASQADEWVPIRPGTDAAMALAMQHVLVHELELIDVAYLKGSTNAPYLVGPDGHYVRDPERGAPLVWDARRGQAAPHDQVPPEDVALNGTYEVHQVTARTGFELLRDHVRTLTPEWAEEITTVPASTTRRLAREFGEAARIGSTITIDGALFPHRPAAACYYRGVAAHKHALHNGFSLAQLNMLIGAIDAPGGMINGTAANPFWNTEVGPDGLLIGGGRGHRWAPLPLREVQAPETLQMLELFPLAFGSHAMIWLHQAEPSLAKQLGLDYQIEVLIHCRTNIVATGPSPDFIARGLKNIPFQISLATHHDETTQFADLLLPDQHALERLGGIAYNTYTNQSYPSAARPGEDWAFNLQQPVVEPSGEARFWGEVLVDLAYRLGLTEEFNQAFNIYAALKGSQRLESGRPYAWPEMLDRQLKSLFGDTRGLEYFRQHGYYSTGTQRTPAESYTQTSNKGRVPLYAEYFLSAGEQVRTYMDSRGVDWWETSDYVPLPHWKPCPAQDTPPEYDLFAVNQKLPYLTFSFTQHNAWLTELAEHNGKVFPVAINAATARQKGLREGDRVLLDTPSGRSFPAVLRVTEGIHPECLAIAGIVGRQLKSLEARQRKGVHFNGLLEYTLEQMDFTSGAMDACAKVKIRKAS